MKLSQDQEPLFKMAAQTDAHVLITGPTGTGKSLLAKSIHDQSLRKEKPFVVINLATLHEGTLESELFGHEKGSFTGAQLRRVGRLEMAQGGTVFLDEIGELSPKLQARLLEFLQFKKITPVGSNREIQLDIRVIAATLKDLYTSVSKGEFREDLFHRLCVLSFELKPLIDRHQDFDSIVHLTLEELSKNSNRKIVKVSEGFAERLESHTWPGNIRELRNVLEYALLAGTGTELLVSELPPWFGNSYPYKLETSTRLLGVAEMPLSLDYHDTISRFEKEYLKRALHYCRGRVNKTARTTGMNKTTLIRRLRAYGLGS